MDQNPKSSSLSKLAIDAALDYKWDEALRLNKQILKLDPQNIDALNRQARVYMEMGRSTLAKKYYIQVIKLDPYNPIALKNLKIVRAFKENGKDNGHILANHINKLSPTLFLQEPGKTKVVSLLKVAEPQKLSQAFCGMKVDLLIKNRKITIVDLRTNYLGVLPDDISHHLLRLLRGGNKYELFIKAIRVNSLSVLIKETYRSKRFKNQPSFLDISGSNFPTEIITSFDNQDRIEEEAEETEEAVT